MHERLIKQEDLLERLIEAHVGAPTGPAFRAILAKERQQLKEDIAAQEARFNSYTPDRPVHEPHDAQCQIVRFGPKDACTCRSNMTRRRQQVINAGKAKDRAFRETLGSMESMIFDNAEKGIFR